MRHMHIWELVCNQIVAVHGYEFSELKIPYDAAVDVDFVDFS